MFFKITPFAPKNKRNALAVYNNIHAEVVYSSF